MKLNLRCPQCGKKLDITSDQMADGWWMMTLTCHNTACQGYEATYDECFEDKESMQRAVREANHE